MKLLVVVRKSIKIDISALEEVAAQEKRFGG
jgi:hypothetical protein